MDNREEAILHYWFGKVEETALPSEHRTWVWFSGDQAISTEIKTQFYDDFMKATRGELEAWAGNSRKALALIILLDQFSRHIYYRTAQAFEQDKKALALCLQGIELGYDHELSLIERVFFYFPLMHSENIDMQILSVRAYQMLASIAFPETRAVFEKFLDYAIKHQEIISQFGRFPYRNEILGRPSTTPETEFLKNMGFFFE